MIKLGILVGHSDKAKGAYSASLQAHEYTLWTEVAIEIWREARELGIDAKVFKRDGISIEKVGQLVSGWADYAIELHFNSAAKRVKNPNFGTNNQPEYIETIDIAPNGCETLYDAHPPESRAFAQVIHSAMLRALTEPNPNYSEHRKDTNPFSKPKDRGVKLIQDGDRGHRNLSSVTIPSCLIEPFFGSHALDCQRFKRNRAQFCRALVSSVLQFKLLEK
jgi:N-acetylmuramoyl-L-alanine amidase